MASNKTKGASLQNAMPAPGKALSGGSTPVDDDQDPMNDYETQGHMKTLIDAHQIMNDPVKMAKVHKLAGRHENAIKGIKQVGDINDARNAKYGGKNAMNALKSPEQSDDGE